MTILQSIISSIVGIAWTFSTPAIFEGVRTTLWGVATVLAVIFFILLYKLQRLRAEPQPAAVVPTDPELEARVNFQSEWLRIKQYQASDHQSDWKLAVLEADTLLDDLIRRRGYPGETLGERLKSITAKDLATLESAWEAHKVRNRIAHDGAAFELSRAEAERVIYLYELVFREVGYLADQPEG